MESNILKMITKLASIFRRFEDFCESYRKSLDKY